MKVRSARKSRVSPKRAKKESLFERTDDKDASNIDLLDVEIISVPSTTNSSGRIQLSIASLPNKLISQGFDKIEIVAEENATDILPAQASPQQIEDYMKKITSEEKPSGVKTSTIDLTESISKKNLPGIVNNLEMEEEDEEIELKFVKSVNLKLDKKTISSDHITAESFQTDRQGILELRLGKDGKDVNQESIQEISKNKFNFATSVLGTSISEVQETIDFSKNISTEIEEVHPEAPLLKMLKGKDSNSGNKKRPSLLRRSEIKKSLSNINSSRIQKPLIKSVNRKQSRKITTNNIKLDLPGPKSNLSIKITDRNTGKIYRKPIKPRRFPVIPYRITYPYKSDLNIPKISISYLTDNQAIVSLSDIHPNIKKLDIYRRDISSRPHEDMYELINTVEDPAEAFKFIDNLENAKAFKYVCVADQLSIYSFAIYRNRGFKYENIQEPFVYAFQSRERVLIMIEKLPNFCKKILVYRKSSAEDLEVLVDAISLYGKGRRKLKLVDEPIPIEQAIRYKFIWIDENGIENTFEERPEVLYTSKLGVESGNITKMDVLYNRETSEVNISGEAFVENVFIASNDSEIKNPTETTLLAAARGQLIVKMQVRRINLKTGDDEIILKEIINPGLSKFKTNLNSLNRLSFSFSDSGENAAIFGYTPLFDNTRYVYIGRIIIYPLGLELSKVSDFTTLKGVKQPGRLQYEFDPAIFDHPLNTELGILPAGANQNSYHAADLIGQTPSSIQKKVKVLQSDIDDSISLTGEIHSDSVFDPVIKINGSIPFGLLDDIDHVAIEMSYDTVKGSDVIDRLFLLNESFEYYDYSFDDLACETIKYTLVGIAKDFRELFRSEPVKISMKDPKLRLIEKRRKSIGNLKSLRHANNTKARMRLDRPEFSRGFNRGDENG